MATGTTRETIPGESDAVSVQAEAGLASEADQIEEQARRSRAAVEGENLLSTPVAGSPGTESGNAGLADDRR
jgi:hypothetical protein